MIHTIKTLTRFSLYLGFGLLGMTKVQAQESKPVGFIVNDWEPSGESCHNIEGRWQVQRCWQGNQRISIDHIYMSFTHASKSGPIFGSSEENIKSREIEIKHGTNCDELSIKGETYRGNETEFYVNKQHRGIKRLISHWTGVDLGYVQFDILSQYNHINNPNPFDAWKLSERRVREKAVRNTNGARFRGFKEHQEIVLYRPKDMPDTLKITSSKQYQQKKFFGWGKWYQTEKAKTCVFKRM